MGPRGRRTCGSRSRATGETEEAAEASLASHRIPETGAPPALDETMANIDVIAGGVEAVPTGPSCSQVHLNEQIASIVLTLSLRPSILW